MELSPVVAKRRSIYFKAIGAVVFIALISFASFYAAATYLGYHVYSSQTKLENVVITCNGITSSSTCSPAHTVEVDLSTPNGAEGIEIQLTFTSYYSSTVAVTKRLAPSQLYIGSYVSVIGNLSLGSVDTTYEVNNLFGAGLPPSVFVSDGACGISCPTVRPGYFSVSLEDHAPYQGGSESNGLLLLAPPQWYPPYPVGFTLSFVVRASVPSAGSGPFSLAQSYLGNVTIPFYADSNYTASMGYCKTDQCLSS